MKKAISTVLVIGIVMSLVFVSAYATGSPPFSKQYLSGISGVEYKRYQALEDKSQQGVLLTQQSLEVYDCFDYWISNGMSWDNLIKRIQKAFEDAGFKNSTVDNGDIVLEKGDEVFVLWSEQRAYSVFNESAVVIVQHFLKKTETPTPTPTPTLTPEPTPTPTPSPTPTSSFTTVLSAQNLSVNGTAVACEKYNIDGSNYFKLRDLAALLNGTGSQFDVGWDGEKGVVSITTNHAYSTPNGTELVVGADQSATAQVSAQTIMINGTVRTDLTVYNIGGSNFFKLREMGDALGFAVDYDSTSNTAIVASKDYVASGVPEPQTQNEIFTYLKNYVINNGEKDIYDDYNYIFFTKNGEGPSSTKYPYTYHINVRLTYDSYTDELLLVSFSSTKYLKGSSYSDHRTSSVSQVTIVFPKEMTGTYSYKCRDLSGYADTTLLKETYSSSGTIDASAFNYVMETWVPNKATKVEERIPSNAFGIISDGRFVSDAMDVEYALKSLEEELLPKTPYSISDLGFMAINLSD